MVSSYTITTACLVLWYMCVLLTWMHINQTMKLFSSMAELGWLVIVISFVASLAVNFIFNPLMWVVAGCYIHQARKNNLSSKWQFYPPMIGILLLASVMAAVLTNVKIPPALLPSVTQTPPQNQHPNPHPSVREVKVRIPEVSGIMFSEGDPKALINGYVVRQGEEIDGFKVDRIQEGAVTFITPDGKSLTQRVK